MERKIEAVIFDWAGTTVDFGCFAPVQAFISAFEEFGITPTVEEVRKPMGMLKRDHIKTMMNMERIHQEWKRIHGRDFTEKDVDQVYEVSERSILKILDGYAAPKPYVLESVKRLREMGIKIGSTTGYTDEMMAIVVPKAKELGYAPDCWFSPNSVENMGRPYPYMIFKNLQELRVSSVKNVWKVGDTVSDIKEGIAAGVITVGVIEGSSVMALSEEQYNALSDEEKKTECEKVRKIYENAGADYVIQNMSELPKLVGKLS
ncbi:MAG: phosphonoacetaldehyde hydrolase [Blautia sp.]|nr:phosphonoacetaldehyde hydrolase [Blautia sp.]